MKGNKLWIICIIGAVLLAMILWLAKTNINAKDQQQPNTKAQAFGCANIDENIVTPAISCGNAGIILLIRAPATPCKTVERADEITIECNDSNDWCVHAIRITSNIQTPIYISTEYNKNGLRVLQKDVCKIYPKQCIIRCD